MSYTKDREVVDLARDLLVLARQTGHTVATAESCTGGLIASVITEVPGASDVFMGGIVAYANSAKTRVLEVSPATLQEHGAVSVAVAMEMARGARLALGATAAVSVTGIAGPGGGSASKPVGTVYMALSCRDTMAVFHLHCAGDRQEIRCRTARAALEGLQCAILGKGSPAGASCVWGSL